MLPQIIQEFESRNPGVASFETFAAECMAAMKKDSGNASIFLMLALAARQFYERFADQPLTVAEAEESRDAMLALARAAGEAIGGDAGGKLDVLNDIAMRNFSAA
jgi:hypothetical protein